MKIQESDASIISGSINEDNIQFYKDFGYLIAPDLFQIDEIDGLREETYLIFTGERGEIQGLDKENVHLDKLTLAKKYAAIHFPHKISPLIKDFSSNIKVAEILTGIISPNVKCMQSMLFMKAPGKTGQSWHQDEYFIPTRDRSLTGAWIAIDDADIENGCLWVIPSSHKQGVIQKRIPYKGDEFADVEVADIGPYKNSDFVPVEVKAGSVVFFNGYLLHMSYKNRTTNKYRRALVSHYCSAESMLPWNQDGRFEPTEDFRDIFMVAGEDPYADKGLQDLSQPFIRPDVLDFKPYVEKTEK